ncbi:hypothetical protein GRI38_10975 [Altererythrobacter aurantiacus]|uniref:Lipoprotein n=1 Tax=Parapontixanthobacter aurantiacus TaxID=1463599 RepID=A0A844ZHC7_9SPHN|nr:hypothetical protein [Parapontixanthobacter aurantiacus]MXO86546.1 hypothetical protein [Parapontixanthobacter aurantiacus]
MRRYGFAIAAPLLLLGGCSDEPDFDERYEAAREEIETKAQLIDAELEATEAQPKATPTEQLAPSLPKEKR